ATAFTLAGACIELLFGLSALRSGFAAWNGFLGVLRSPPLVLFNLFLLVGIAYFALRFLWVGIKVATVAIGPVPAPPAPVIMVAHYGGLLVVTLVVLVLFSGAIL